MSQESRTRARYEIARAHLHAMKTSTTSAEFSVSFLGLLTYGRSVLDVARSEAARHRVRHPMKRRIDLAEGEPLVEFFVGARNAALKEDRYLPMRAVVSVDLAATIRLQITSDDVLISPSRGIDESKEPRAETIMEIGIRKPVEPTAATAEQEFYFVSGPYSGQNVISLSEQYLGRLEPIISQVEELITNPSSGSAR